MYGKLNHKVDSERNELTKAIKDKDLKTIKQFVQQGEGAYLLLDSDWKDLYRNDEDMFNYLIKYVDEQFIRNGRHRLNYFIDRAKYISNRWNNKERKKVIDKIRRNLYYPEYDPNDNLNLPLLERGAKRRSRLLKHKLLLDRLFDQATGYSICYVDMEFFQQIINQLLYKFDKINITVDYNKILNYSIWYDNFMTLKYAIKNGAWIGPLLFRQYIAELKNKVQYTISL